MKKIVVVLLFVATILCFSSCKNFRGYDWIDTKYSFDYAIIKMPSGEILTVEIEKWADSNDGEQLTITAKDGTVYLVNSVNCVLVKE